MGIIKAFNAINAGVPVIRACSRAASPKRWWRLRRDCASRFHR